MNLESEVSGIGRSSGVEKMGFRGEVSGFTT